jgi:hypothetical protein
MIYKKNGTEFFGLYIAFPLGICAKYTTYSPLQRSGRGADGVWMTRGSAILSTAGV